MAGLTLARNTTKESSAERRGGRGGGGRGEGRREEGEGGGRGGGKGEGRRKEGREGGGESNVWHDWLLSICKDSGRAEEVIEPHCSQIPTPACVLPKSSCFFKYGGLGGLGV